MAVLQPLHRSPILGFVRSEILAGGQRDYGRASRGEDVVALTAGAAGSLAAGLYAVADAPVFDKLQHGGICFATTVALGTLGLPPSLTAGFVFSSATLAKEFLWDGFLGNGTFDGKDVAANLSGSLAGYSTLKLAGLAQDPPEGRGR